MICMKYLVVILLLNLVLADCANNNNVILDHCPSDVYTYAQQKMQEGNYTEAISKFKALENRYPFGQYAQQVKLNLIYAYYKSANLQMAQASIEDFLRFNPDYSNIDYLLYIRSLTNMVFDDSKTQGFYGVNHLTSNSDYASVALFSLTQLLIYYPKSPYTLYATNCLLSLKDRLAKHEILVVEYYAKIGAYVAVANRVDKMLREFPDNKATRQILYYMGQAYRELHLYE
ncbi:UPF0169 lipoprotein yfiO [Candidatus Moranella endobia PCVAL]|uniref:Outer membrane protein assembly factor BamD n=1 Tax=Moranella endobia (strain PCIT) TaxID=903503 RepID=F7XXJ4_MOREP|nr:outer membrane protein assembly factor BamD [Candidatus Moranella endobia]AEI74820.1 putative outer membrane protein assembly complex subunit YfiO [Candidatus Moranella endobia PCIT]AGJ61477.1 UPF0169 lipoprotein yfiO [Candidatus Moranella endobia PCVAL]